MSFLRLLEGLRNPVCDALLSALTLMGDETVYLVVCLVVFAMWGHWWTLCILPVWAWHLWYVWTHDSALDKQMPVLMFSTLAVAVLALF